MRGRQRPAGAAPQGIAVRFHLGEHVHTDSIAHSHNGFPARTGEEFLELLHAAAASGPVIFHVMVQLAEAGDDPTNGTVVWPESRPKVEFGTITLVQREDGLDPERRKIIFDPVPRVDGIDPAGDPLTEIRSDLYLTSGRRRRAAAQ